MRRETSANLIKLLQMDSRLEGMVKLQNLLKSKKVMDYFDHLRSERRDQVDDEGILLQDCNLHLLFSLHIKIPNKFM